MFGQVKRNQLQNFTNYMVAASRNAQKGESRNAAANAKFAVTTAQDYRRRYKAQGDIAQQQAWKARQEWAEKCAEAL